MDVPYGWSVVATTEYSSRTVECAVCGVQCNEYVRELDDRDQPYVCCVKCLVSEV